MLGCFLSERPQKFVVMWGMLHDRNIWAGGSTWFTMTSSLLPLFILQPLAGMAELVDATDLKSVVL